jgi:hypothetical protein
MLRHILLIGAATVALTVGAVAADSVVTETTTTKSVTTPLPPVTAPLPPVTVLSPPAAVTEKTESKTERTVDAYGRETQRSEVSHSDSGLVTHKSSTTVRDADGALQSERHEEWQQTPVGSSSSTTTTTTRTR